MARYAKYVHEMHSIPKELKILPTTARKFPLIMDGAISPGVSHHIEVMFITESGTDYIPQQPFELPPIEQLPDLVKDVFFTGSQTGSREEPNEPFYLTKEGKIVFQHKPMYHLVEEMFLFFGTNPDDQTDLGGEVELWLGLGDRAEKYIITKPSLVTMPPGLVHCPMVFRNVRRLMIEIVIYTGPELDERGVDEWPPDYKP